MAQTLSVKEQTVFGPLLSPEQVTRTHWASLSCGRKSCTSIRKPLRLATWNVRTLLVNEDTNRPAPRSALIDAELSRYTQCDRSRDGTFKGSSTNLGNYRKRLYSRHRLFRK